jgi:hypothetical protein
LFVCEPGLTGKLISRTIKLASRMEGLDSMRITQHPLMGG